MLVLDLTTGVCWTLAYIAAIILGIRNRTWCIPKMSICMNFSWECLVVIHRILFDSIGLPFCIQASWMLLDIVIIGTWLIYDSGKSKLLKNLCLFIIVFIVMYLWAYRGGAWETTVFLVNLVMSAEFIYRRAKDHTPWTSRVIAVAKMVGTLSATILEGLILWNPMILYIGGMCFLMDLYYTATLFSKDSF